MVSAMATDTTTRFHELILSRRDVEDNCPFREQVATGEFGPSHRCHLQDYIFGIKGVRDHPITAVCEPGEIADVCPMLIHDFKISLA